MTEQDRMKYLRIALVSIGLIFIVGLYIMMWLWPAGFGWLPRQAEYEQMIMGVYATLGVFLVRAARNPLANASLIWFTVWSSLVHGVIMLLQALADSREHAHLYGDILALFLVAIILGYLMPRRMAAN